MSLLQRFEQGLKAYLRSFAYPFTQKDWMQKMWLIGVVSYIPFINLILARGWRLELVHRMGWGHERPLPPPRDIAKFFSNGVLLWLATAIYLSIPLIIISVFGLDGFSDFRNDVQYLLLLTWDSLWNSTATGDYASQVSSYVVTELWESFWAFLIQNIYLVIYVPVYRIGMIRFSLTKNLLNSHLAFGKNLKFIYRNFLEVVLLYFFFLFEFIVIMLANWVLALTVIGILFIPITTVYMHYWSTGYQYGRLAKLMVAQEEMAARKTEVPIAATGG